MQASVRLERPTARHEREFVAAALRSRALHRGLVVPPATPAEYRAYLRVARRDTQESYLVIEAESASLAGVININDIVREHEQSGRLGYYAFVPWAGKGLMRAGLELVIRSAFRELGLHRLVANVQSGNVRSIALVEGFGFEREGTMHGFLKIGHRWRDHQRWALLKDDWP